MLLTALSDGMSLPPPFLAQKQISTHYSASTSTRLGPQETPE